MQPASSSPTSSDAFEILRQPTDTSCGPTCLHAIYAWHGKQVNVETLIEAVPTLPHGGTLAVYLGIDALRRGFEARLYSCNLRVLDPSWFPGKPAQLLGKLAASREVRESRREREELRALETFVDCGGELGMEPVTRDLLRRHLAGPSPSPILTGLSATFLYRDCRENPVTGDPDDLRGQPEGHFVVLFGYDRPAKEVMVHDPYPHTPFEGNHRYAVHIDRLINAILLGVLTFDANILVIRPQAKT